MSTQLMQPQCFGKSFHTRGVEASVRSFYVVGGLEGRITVLCTNSGDSLPVFSGTSSPQGDSWTLLYGACHECTWVWVAPVTGWVGQIICMNCDSQSLSPFQVMHLKNLGQKLCRPFSRDMAAGHSGRARHLGSPGKGFQLWNQRGFEVAWTNADADSLPTSQRVCACLALDPWVLTVCSALPSKTPLDSPQA